MAARFLLFTWQTFLPSQLPADLTAVSCLQTWQLTAGQLPGLQATDLATAWLLSLHSSPGADDSDDW
jgi:hypothetical protein